MIDLVLQDTCVPTLRSYCDWFCSLVQTFHAYACTATNYCGKACDMDRLLAMADRRAMELGLAGTDANLTPDMLVP